MLLPFQIFMLQFEFLSRYFYQSHRPWFLHYGYFPSQRRGTFLRGLLFFFKRGFWVGAKELFSVRWERLLRVCCFTPRRNSFVDRWQFPPGEKLKMKFHLLQKWQHWQWLMSSINCGCLLSTLPQHASASLCEENQRKPLHHDVPGGTSWLHLG